MESQMKSLLVNEGDCVHSTRTRNAFLAATKSTQCWYQGMRLTDYTFQEK